ncbi:MAG: hypothetical protein SGI74_12295 [Oligoflexia bacterium]|nr:hypothetical protein [Oligoflexia bacterium]
MSNTDNKIKINGAMPAPPDFLLTKFIVDEPIHTFVQSQYVEKQPSTVDYIIYQSAIEDRKQAEISSAEIYSKYLELINFNEKLLRIISNYKRYKIRARQVYNHAKISDQILIDNLDLTRKSLVSTERAMNTLQIENETLRISISAHEEAFKSVTSKLGQAEATMEQANTQFRNLAEEFNQRNLQLDEAQRTINAYTTQISHMGDAMREMQSRFSQMRDENLLYQNQLREVQIREAGIAALNSELTNSATKAQKQIHELDDKLTHERENFRSKISALEQENSRLKDKRYAEQLIEKSKKIQEQQPAQSKLNIADEKLLDRKNLEQFMNRWTKIIDELSAQSSRISHTLSSDENEERDNSNYAITEQLISERGDLQIID